MKKNKKKILLISLIVIIVLAVVGVLLFFVLNNKTPLGAKRDDKVKIYHTENGQLVYYMSEKEDFEIYSDFRKVDKYVSVEYDIDLDGGIEINGIGDDYSDYVTLNDNHVKIDLKKCFDVTEESDGKYCPLTYDVTLKTFKNASFTLKNITLYDKDGNKYVRKDKEYKPDFGGGDVYICNSGDKYVNYSYKKDEGCMKTGISFDAGNYIMSNVYTDKYILLYNKGEYKVYDVKAEKVISTHKYDGNKGSFIYNPNGYSIKEDEFYSDNYGETIGFINYDNFAISFKSGKSTSLSGLLDRPDDYGHSARYYSARNGYLATQNCGSTNDVYNRDNCSGELVYNLDNMQHLITNGKTIVRNQETVRRYNYIYTSKGIVEVDITKNDVVTLGKTNKVFISTVDGKNAYLVEADNEVVSYGILLNQPKIVNNIIGIEKVPRADSQFEEAYGVYFVTEKDGIYEGTSEETDYLAIITPRNDPQKLIKHIFRLNKSTGNYEYYKAVEEIHEMGVED